MKNLLSVLIISALLGSCTTEKSNEVRQAEKAKSEMDRYARYVQNFSGVTEDETEKKIFEADGDEGLKFYRMMKVRMDSLEIANQNEKIKNDSIWEAKKESEQK